MFGLSAFWATVVKVELTDIVFAVDSILVAVAMSSKTWVILTGGVLGIIAMRMVIGKLLSLIQKYPALVDGAFIIIRGSASSCCWSLPTSKASCTFSFRSGCRSGSSSSSSRSPFSMRGDIRTKTTKRPRKRSISWMTTSFNVP